MSPQAADVVPVEEGLVRDENEVARQRLRYEHSVEGIAERTRKRSGARGVVHGDGQLLEVLAGYGACNIAGQSLRFRQFAFSMLGRDLPSRRSAYQHVVVVTFYQPPSG